jgi:hypothetical protein
MKTFREYLEDRDDELYNEMNWKGGLSTLAGLALGMFGGGGAVHGQEKNTISPETMDKLGAIFSGKPKIDPRTQRLFDKVDAMIKDREQVDLLLQNLVDGKLNDFIIKPKTTEKDKEIMDVLERFVGQNPGKMHDLLIAMNKKYGGISNNDPVVKLIFQQFPEIEKGAKEGGRDWVNQISGIVYDLSMRADKRGEFRRIMDRHKERMSDLEFEKNLRNKMVPDKDK